MSVKEIFLKAAAPTQPTYAMKGRLVLSKSGWLLLEVPNAVMHGVFNTLDEPGIELPSYEGRINAHISVMPPEDLTKIGGPSKITERGQLFSYTTGRLKTVAPKIPGVSRVWMVEVKSPELTKLRRSYGLSSLPQDNYEFHITVAQRKVNVLGNNSVAKSTVELRDDRSQFDKLDANEFVGSQSLKVAEFFRHVETHGRASQEDGVALFGDGNRATWPSNGTVKTGESSAISAGAERAARSSLHAIRAETGREAEKEAALADFGGATVHIGSHSVSAVLTKLAAVGLPDRRHYGDPTKVPSGSTQDMIVKRHMAEKAGPHYDFRFGGPKGLFSWALRHPLPGPGQKRLAVQQPMHSYKKKDFEGIIPPGYGAGKVSTHEEGQLRFTKVSPTAIHFTTEHRKNPEQFVMFKPKGWGEKDWMIMNTTKPGQTPRYKKVPADQVEQLIQKMQHGETVEAKVDGASSLVKIIKDGVETVSYGTETERLEHDRPSVQPTEAPEPVLPGDLYGRSSGGSVHSPGNGGRDPVATGGDAGLYSVVNELSRTPTGPANGSDGVGGGVGEVSSTPGDAGQAGPGINSQELGSNADARLADIGQPEQTKVAVDLTESTDETEAGVPLERLDANVADKNVGFVTSHPTDTGRWLEGMHVLPKNQGQGIGKALLEKLLAKYPTDDISLLARPYENAPMSQEQLQQFYTQFGFEPTDDEGRMQRGKVAADISTADFFKSPPNKQGRKCPGCDVLFKECEPLSDVKMCEICERFGPSKEAADKKKRKPTVAVDMDGTLAKHFEKYDPDNIPDPRPNAKKVMQDWRDKGYRLIIFTVRGDKKVVKAWLEKHEIPFDYINENPSQPPDSSGKVLADVYVDDRAVDGARSWKVIAETAGKRLEKKSTSLKQIIAKAVRRIRAPVSDAQAEAGNYRKGHIHMHGLPISIETKAGEKRRPEWPALKHSYGYIKGTEDRDGDQVDVFIGPSPETELVYVVDQINPSSSRFDEHKCMLGFTSLKDAKQGYLDNYETGWKGLGKITPLTVQQFKQWLKTGEQTKSLGSQVVQIKAASVLISSHNGSISLIASEDPAWKSEPISSRC